ncbi:MAG TPA: succinate dehydrogenase, cytochrome b556 subunit [Steroidobacteraceae bacterium]|jgi:succinate dehydrogenase / fumarate reductase cytochrome b subunit
MAERPLSPHLTVYRWGYTMTLSILHRMTGVALAFALLGLVAWLVSASLGPSAFAALVPLLTSAAGKIIAALAVTALIYHFCNGLRHLAWDLGFGYERVDARRSAVLVMVVTLIAAAICIYLIFRPGAGAA